MKKILVLSIAIIVFIGGFILIALLGRLKTSAPPPQTFPSPTIVGQNLDPETSPAIQYDKQATDTLLRTVTTRPTPSSSDAQIRQQLIERLNNNSGILSQTQNYTLEYSKAPDSFSVEIKTTDVDATKQQAISYLQSQGLSNDGICKLPLFFYLDYNTSQSLKNSGETFNPIPDFCK